MAYHSSLSSFFSNVQQPLLYFFSHPPWSCPHRQHLFLFLLFSLSSNPLHFLECRLLRSFIISRHDRIIHTIARISRLIGISVVPEPRIGSDMSRTDANFFLSSLSAHTDVCVVHPSASSYFKLASKPLGASSKREKHKDNLYLQRAKAIGSLFFPLVFESFGAIGTSPNVHIEIKGECSGRKDFLA